MEEQETPTYKEGDIVWVKLGPCWWPGQVKNKDEIEPELEKKFKKPPLVIVKFFEEDNYEFVKNWSNIYPYNSEKKSDFIKKGMNAFRAKWSHMEKFPKDVTTAETLIGGNPNILSDPMYLPEKKVNVVAEIFGTASPKKKTDKKKSRSSKPDDDKSYISHRRFLGNDDYKAFICIQYPGKDKDDPKDREEIIRLNREPDEVITCHACSFSTTRFDVMVLHTKNHVRSGKHMVSVKKKLKKTKKRKSKLDLSDEDISDGEVVKKKKRGRSTGTKKIQQKEGNDGEEGEENKNTSKDIRTDLLAEWDESDEDDSDDKDKSADAEESLNSTCDSADKSLDTSATLTSDETLNTATKDDNKSKSCFDFDENEDDNPIIPTATSGRKIPRVIPVTERRKTNEDEDDVENKEEPKEIEEEAVLDEKIVETPKRDVKKSIKEHKEFEKEPEESQKECEEPKKDVAEPNKEEMDNGFNELMELTAVPELPEIQNNLKCEQNFHSVPTIKFPDKPDLTERSSPNIEKSEKSENVEAATKLTNPKKRFVKSFEDFEKEVKRKEELEDKTKKQEELDKSEEQSNKEVVEKEVPKSPAIVQKTESAVSEQMESPILNQDCDTLARLKNQIMSKMKSHKKGKSTEEPSDKIKLPYISKIVLDTTGRKSPRNKTLRSSISEQEKVQELQREAEVTKIDEPKKEILPPKKNKWSRRPSHSKKDRILSMSAETVVHQTAETNLESAQESVKSPPKTEVEIPLNKPYRYEEPEQEKPPVKETTYEKYNVDAFSLSHKDDFSPVEKASVHLPEDAICSPPRKNKKRKISLETLEDTILSEKKIKSNEAEKVEDNLETKLKDDEENFNSNKDDFHPEKVPPTIESIFEDKPEDKQFSEAETDKVEESVEEHGIIKEHGIIEEPAVTEESAIVEEPAIIEEQVVYQPEEIVTEEIIDVGFEEKYYESQLKTNEQVVRADNVEQVKEVAAENEVPNLAEATVEESTKKVEQNQQKLDNQTEVCTEPPKTTEENEVVDTQIVNIDFDKPTECLEEIIYDHIHDQEQFDKQSEMQVEGDKKNLKAEEIMYPEFLNPEPASKDSDNDALQIPKEPIAGELSLFPEPELVQIEGNLTVVSEKDLADGQVEITSEQVINSKKNVLTNFSMDFSDSTNDSSSTSETLVETHKVPELTTKAMLKEYDKGIKIGNKKGNGYELLDMLQSSPMSVPKKLPIDDFCDFEDHIPSQIVCAKKLKQDKEEALREEAIKEAASAQKPTKTKYKNTLSSTTSKLLQRLTDGKKETDKDTSQKPKTLIKGGRPASAVKPVILSEQVIRPAETKKVIVTKGEDGKRIIIQRDLKKIKPEETVTSESNQVVDQKCKGLGKAKILQQTIITPTGEIIQPDSGIVQTDDNIFDINSMPIVLSDQILTPESIEHMPIVISGKSTITTTLPQEKVLVTIDKKPVRKLITKVTGSSAVVTQPVAATGAAKVTKNTPRILQSNPGRIIKQTIIPGTSKGSKYIIVPQSAALTPVTTKNPVKKIITKPQLVTDLTTKTATIPEAMKEGNKIMIVTNPQGQQQRLLLTPAQQKMLGCQSSGAKITKTIIKSSPAQKTVIKPETTVKPGVITQKIVIPSSAVASSNQQFIQGNRVVKSGNIAKKVQPSVQKVVPNMKNQKTIVIKNQIVRKPTGSEDDLEKQVAEQLEAIRASSSMKSSPQPKVETPMTKAPPKTPIRRNLPKKIETKPNKPITSTEPPSLIKLSNTSTPKKQEPAIPEPKPQERPLNQLVIQDAVGTQTTITEGQIIALPSETAVDGQPHSYMLVTLDEHGNLTPLNNEALMSLDPNLTGDLNNVVLQIEPSAIAATPPTPPQQQQQQPKPVEVEVSKPKPEPVKPPVHKTEPVPIPEQTIQSVINVNGEPGQQLLISGEPGATQKFFESLLVGSPDLANILANADGNSILIHADGQQILINTNTDNQMLLSVNSDANVNEITESRGNPIFATQPAKNQDILAAALADTDVLQQDQHTSQKLPSQLSPNNALYPINVGNVLETSLTLSSPIMTPLEVPSTNNKKIPDDEADILTQVPKNVDLPITITDPNISQTVANQQVASLIATELQTNLDLTLPIAESAITVTKEMTSPSFLSTLDEESVGMPEKTFPNNMPLLTEDVEDLPEKSSEVTIECETTTDKEESDSKVDKEKKSHGFLKTSDDEDEEEIPTRFILGSKMCSSLSEPPPEEFDFPEINPTYDGKTMSDNTSKDDDTTDLSTLAESSNDGSLEIPVQPPIVAKSQTLDEFTSD